MIGWIRHIEYLLLHNDRVVVPELGCFSVKHSEARLLTDRCSFLPPTRTIVFEYGVTDDSDILVRSWMRARFISYHEALNEIINDVQLLQEELKRTHRYDLGRLGCLVETKGTVMLQVNQDNAFEYPRFGFAPLTINSREAVVEENLADKDIDEQFVKNPDRVYISFPRRTLRIASVAAAVIVFLLMVSRPVNTPDTSVDYAGVLTAELFAQSAEQAVVDTTDLWEPVVTTDEVEDTPIVEKPTLPETKPAVPETQTVTPVKEKKYYVIVASLPTRALAEKQIECFRQQGITVELSIYETANKARLYAATFDTMAEAQQYIAQQKAFESAWVMKAGN